MSLQEKMKRSGDDIIFQVPMRDRSSSIIEETLQGEQLLTELKVEGPMVEIHEELLKYMEPVDLPEKSILPHLPEKGKTEIKGIYYIQDGKICALRHSKAPIMLVLGKGSWFGSDSAILESTNATYYSFMAQTPVKLLILHYSVFSKLLLEEPVLFSWLIANLARDLRGS